MLLAMDNTKLSTGMFGIGELNLSPIQSGPIPALKIPLVSGVSALRGIAPATFARNSSATYIDDDGLLQTAGIDVPRFQNGRYLAEVAATNILSYSELLTNSYWLKNNLSVVEDTTKGSFKLTNTATDICYTYSTNIVATNGVYYTQSAVLEKGNTNFASMTFANALSQILLPYAIFNLDLGTISYTKDCVATITPLSDNKFRCSITALSSYCFGAPFGVITPSRNGAARITGVIGDYIYATKLQVETGTQATSYIPTTTVPMDRVGDVLHYTVGDVITQGQGSLYCEFIGMTAFGVIKTALTLSDNTLDNRLYPYIAIDGKITLKGAVGGTYPLTITGNTVLPALNKILITYKAGETKFYSNGVLIGTSAAYTVPASLTKLNVGSSQNGTDQLNSEIGNVKYFKEVLTQAEAIKITTL